MARAKKKLLLSALFLLTAPALAGEVAKPAEYSAVVLQGLNKVTGRMSKFDGALGTVLRFGNLEIIARRCWKAPPEERPESAALLDISELKAGEEPAPIFLGWMFAASPGLSGLEHPVYDITVLACETRKEAETPQDPEDAALSKIVKKGAE